MPAVTGIDAHLVPGGFSPFRRVRSAVGIHPDAALRRQVPNREGGPQGILFRSQVSRETDPETAPGGLPVRQRAGGLDDDAQFATQPLRQGVAHQGMQADDKVGCFE